MRTPICIPTLLCLLIATLGCGPDRGKEPRGDDAERYAEKICDAIATCGCYDFFVSPASCESEYSKRFKGLASAGLELDAECFDEVLDDDHDLADCGRDKEAPKEWRCTVLQGAKKLGEVCSDHNLELPPFSVSECEGELVCLDGVCAPFGSPGPELGIGEACFSDQSTSCHAAGLYCGADGTCRPESFPGESCTSPFACARVEETSSYCQGLGASAGVCAPAAELGEPCDSEDWFACGLGWCDPGTNACIANGPNICKLTDFPNARPSSL